MSDSQVRTFYSDKNFFITGGTGLVGICLLERILRCLPDAGTVYLLIRPKRGRSVKERMEEIKKNPIFETLLQTKSGDIFKKVIPVTGDVGEPNLGLSPVDRRVLDDVNIIVHSAAGLDFELSPKVAMEVNVVGTRRVMELACQLKELKALVHVSSASVNTFLEESKEILYDVPENVEEITKLVETLSEEKLSLIKPTLLKNHHFFYAFTKHLAEHEVAKYANKFPCTIVRPSMILTTWKEPVPGWTCSKTAFIAFTMGVSAGVIRRLPLISKNVAEVIPVDVVANHLLVAGYHAPKSDSLTIYHCTSSMQKPYRYEIFEELLKRLMHQYPVKSAIWYPHLKTTRSLQLFKISAIFIQMIPVILLDLFLRMTGRCSIISRMRKIWNVITTLEWSVNYKWKLCNNNTIELAKLLNETDKKLFYIDISDIDWKEYSTNMYFGIRKYLHQENLSNLGEARFKNSVLLIAHILWHIVLFSLLWYLMAVFTGSSMTQSAWCVPVLYIIYSFL